MLLKIVLVTIFFIGVYSLPYYGHGFWLLFIKCDKILSWLVKDLQGDQYAYMRFSDLSSYEELLVTDYHHRVKVSKLQLKTLLWLFWLIAKLILSLGNSRTKNFFFGRILWMNLVSMHLKKKKKKLRYCFNTSGM